MSMEALLLLLLAVAMFGASDAAWCVCKADASTTALQKTLDYACGAGADCNPILKVGACYNPNTVVAHCSYAANSYYQRNGQAQTACDFTGTAALTAADPSNSAFRYRKVKLDGQLIVSFPVAGANGCVYPATPSAAATSGSATSTFSPMTGNTTAGGGALEGIDPTGATSSVDHGALPPEAGMPSLLIILLSLAHLKI